MLGKFLVFAQFFVIFLMLLPIGYKISYLEPAIFFVLTGLSVGILALLSNKLGNFNIRPDIKEDAVLITTGIYEHIRHPMYAAVLLTMFGVLLSYVNIVEIILYLILLATIITKMLYEESLWMHKSDEYKEYADKTSRLIPYIF